MEDFRLDSHKLIFHPEKVGEWLKNKDIYPINCELGISSACNHRCIFCCVDYMGYKPNNLSSEIVLKNIKIMKEKGLKSVVLAGNGEPLINKDAVKIINGIKNEGIDVAMSTNGVLFTQDIIKDTLKDLTWVRFSTSAASETNYQKIQGAKKGDLERVFTNIKSAVEFKNKNNLNTTIGVQLVLIPENINEVLELGRIVKKLGVDYYSVKSFGNQTLSMSEVKDKINITEFYKKFDDLERKIKELNDDKFQAIYRSNRISKANINRNYCECWALPFYTFIDGNGDVWPCCIMMGQEGMSFGNIKESTFDQVWDSKKRQEIIEKIRKMNFSECSTECRLDDMNRYLEQLVNPNLHVNFI